ncbi:pullulanase-type alpha-1,6-glucosidase [Saccharophagus degradans]|uniref:Pullulanase-type alpha-1,6-glucosidase n=1 Tax=Saccharophagus degradans TaxID=86304 RepID=A0AAW7X2Z3_9GAMM|nr:pullulanase-type alpha-1,6-glucosidase [Saccharophagus degradans]MDO6422136.1 pullulanase-type alpha-1,6-glucosidase [Saccharophagus degradans]MDO6607589.1 pullulanase-type alpha-1,6-glucosidase [Saccharophagus degradans]
MNTIKNMMKVSALLLLASGLFACGGGAGIESGEELLSCSVPQVPNSEGSACVDPEPRECPPPTVPDALNEACVVGVNPDAPDPVVFPTATQAILFFNRANGEYDGYRLHNWNSETCDSYASDSLAASWDNGLVHDGVDPVYGAYWILNLKEGHDDCGHFIIHVGTDDAGKEMGGGDWIMPLAQDDPKFTRMNFTFSGVGSVFEFPVPSLGPQKVAIEGAAAHWLDVDTLVWNLDTTDVADVKLHYSATADITVDDDSNVSGSTADLTFATLSEELQQLVPHMASWPAFGNMLTASDVKPIVKGQLIAVAYNADGKAIAATKVQRARVLDALYTAGENDADEATLGVVYDGANINVSVWAPTATSVTLRVFDAAKTEVSSHAMSEDTNTGIWSFAGDSNLDRMFYQFELSVFHPLTQAIETVTTSDPYSVSLSTNGEYSQFVNLADEDLLPVDWNDHTVPTIANFEDAVILEAHIRDFSIRDETVSEVNRGKYLAFTETESNAVKYLQRMAESGVTHFHMLPANDIATVNEDESEQINLTSTVAELCAVKADAPVCGEESDSATLISILESYQYEPLAAQALVESMRSLDGFNWGYDPHHFNAPEGSYASDPDGVARIKEMREMNKALHDLGLRVVLDVVYNHTSASGLWDNSVFDKVVPGYYHRYDENSGGIITSTCCDNTAPENRMMHKFVVDSLVLWAEAYKFDGFRFDIMGHIPKSTILEAREAVLAVDPNTYFYGEGWNWGEVENNRLFVQATQANMAGTEVGTFNDRPRDDIRSAALFNEDGSLDAQDHIRLGLAGTQADFILESNSGNMGTGSTYARASYGLDPADIINYVSKHDNETLWDQLQYGLPESMSLEDRIRAHNIAATIPVMSQGIPFFQLGVDMLRSKSMDRNSYDAGDWFNFVDYTMASNNWDVGLPLAQDNEVRWEEIDAISGRVSAPGMFELDYSSQVFSEFLQIRKSSPLFRLTTSADIIDRVGFHNIGNRQQQGLIVMSIDDGTGLTDLDPANDAIVVVINGTNESQSHTVATAAGFQLHSIQQSSVDSVVAGSTFTAGEGEGTFTVPALTTAVFVKPQSEVQGAGLAANVTQGAPDVAPYGATTVYLPGSMNGWGFTEAFSYAGNGKYILTTELTGGETYGFKLAGNNWQDVNLGAATGLVEEGVDKVLSSGGGDLSFTPSVTATYEFTLDASNTDAPVLNVINEEPYPGTTVYLRGGMNGWGETDAFTYQGGRIYTFVTTLDANTYSFKIGSAGWVPVNFGAGDESNVVLGENLSLAENGGDLNITIDETAEVIFIFDMTTLSEPKLRVFKSEFFGGASVYIRGSMNEWGTANQLAYADGTYSTTISLAAGSYNFKFADASWSSINFGATSAETAALTLGEQAPSLFNSSNDYSITIPADGDYVFTVTGPDGSAPNITVTAAN